MVALVFVCSIAYKVAARTHVTIVYLRVTANQSVAIQRSVLSKKKNDNWEYDYKIYSSSCLLLLLDTAVVSTQ